MNPPASAAEGAEAGNRNTPHRGLRASPRDRSADAAQATHVRAAPREIPERDFLERLGQAWDQDGPQAFTRQDQVALTAVAYLPPEVANLVWRDLSPPYRERLLFACRSVVDLGITCKYILRGTV